MSKKRGNVEELDFEVGEIEGVDSGDDFVVGEIEGVKEESYEFESLREPEEIKVPSDHVVLKIHKNYSDLVGQIKLKNENVTVEEFESYYQVSAKQLKVTRHDAESALGAMNDGKWRILLMNRVGEVASFNNYELVLGIIETQAEESKEMAQLNCRIDANAKSEMDKIRKILGDMTQAQFLEVAIKEYAEKVRAEMI